MAFFVTGVFFCYFFVLPTILQFFVRIEAIEVDAMISVKSYMSFVNSMLLAFGGVFEMPVLVFLLTKLRILKPSFMKKNRGLLTIAVFIAAAIITPPDVVSQLMLAIPMLLLLQLSIFVCIIVDKEIEDAKKKAMCEFDSHIAFFLICICDTDNASNVHNLFTDN